MARINPKLLDLSVVGQGLAPSERFRRRTLEASRSETLMTAAGQIVLRPPCPHEPLQRAGKSGIDIEPPTSMPETPAVAEEIQLLAFLLSGESKKLKLLQTSTSQDLRNAIAAEFCIPAQQQKLLIRDAVLPVGVTISEAGLDNDSQITVIRIAAPQLKTPLHRFTVSLLCARERLNQARYSSNFTIKYDFELDLDASYVRAQYWRRDDNDWCVFDGRKGEAQGERCHWMSGTKPFTHAYEHFDLSEFLSSRMAQAEPVLEPKAFLWTERDDLGSDDHFKLPSASCFELHVDAPLKLGLGRGNGTMRLNRVLLDSAGWPVRVALEETDMYSKDRKGVLHEFDVSLKELSKVT